MLTPPVKERPILFSAPMVRAILAGTKSQTRRALRLPHGLWETSPSGELVPIPANCPYGAPGDRLWVREAFSGIWLHNETPPSTWERSDDMWYWADGNPDYGDWTKPRPSIHMPRWASRILLEVTDVRVQRLQTISETDALDEGIQAMRCPDCHLASYGLPGWGHDQLNPTAQGAYRYLWESINSAGSWDLNPWCWAVSFHRINPLETA